MRSLSPRDRYRLRANLRAARWPLPGLPPVEYHPEVAAALAMVRDELMLASIEREIAASYSLATYSDSPWTVRS